MYISFIIIVYMTFITDITRSPISQFAIFTQLISFKTIEFNRVSIFVHEMFRINVGLNFNLKFSSGILS